MIDEAERWAKLVATTGLAVTLVIFACACSIYAARVLHRDAVLPCVTAFVQFLRDLTQETRQQTAGLTKVVEKLNDIGENLPSLCRFKNPRNGGEQGSKG